jgi:hypothetical protein
MHSDRVCENDTCGVSAGKHPGHIERSLAFAGTVAEKVKASAPAKKHTKACDKLWGQQKQQSACHAEGPPIAR